MELARDMKEEYRRVLVELGVTNLKNMTFRARKELMVLKRQVAAVLLAKVETGRENEV